MLLFWLALVVCPDAATEAKRCDYLLLQAIAPFTVLSRYEQPLTAEERAEWLPGAPLRIDENKTTLGDGLTPALQGSYRGRTWYLQRDDTGRLLGDQPAKRTVLNNCTELADTVVVGPARSVLFSTRPNGSGGTYLPSGERLYRVFRKGTKSYCLRLGGTPAYGWCSGPGLEATAGARTHAADTGLSAGVLEAVGERISRANADYQVFFGHFSHRTGNRKSPPLWTRSGTGAATRWSLSAPYNRTGQLDNSTDVLVRDLQSLLAGQGYLARYRDGAIGLEPQPAGDR